jgi:hypothetical protein
LRRYGGRVPGCVEFSRNQVGNRVMLFGWLMLLVAAGLPFGGLFLPGGSRPCFLARRLRRRRLRRRLRPLLAEAKIEIETLSGH